MKVPLTDEQLLIESTLPRNPTGHIINPVYAQWPWKDEYIRKLGEWCREHPRKDWPDWLVEYVDERKRQREQSSEGPRVGKIRGAFSRTLSESGGVGSE